MKQKRKRAKEAQNPKIIVNLVPMTEEQCEAAVKKLAAMWAYDMGWVPKDSRES